MLQRLRVLAGLAGLALLFACQSPSAPPATTATEGPGGFRPMGGATEAANTPEPGQNFVLRTRLVGGDSPRLVTEVEPAAGYFLNDDPAFPWRVAVNDDAPAAAGTLLRSGDAALLSEGQVRFEIPLEGEAPAGDIQGEVVLGVCDNAGCVRVQTEVTWAAGDDA